MKLIKTIQPIGGYWKMTEEGYLVNDTAIEKVPAHYLPVLEEIKEAYLEQHKVDLLSIYLRGSVARGQMVESFSDLDTFAIVRQDIRWKKVAWSKALNDELQAKYPFIKEVELMLSGFPLNTNMEMLVKTQSLLIFGEDLGQEITPYRVSKALMLNYRWIREDIDDFLAKKTIDETDCQEIMKVIVRTGFELVMERLGKYTTDLYWCAQGFVTYYPRYQSEVEQALHFYLNPTTEKKKLDALVQKLGNFIADKCAKELLI